MSMMATRNLFKTSILPQYYKTQIRSKICDVPRKRASEKKEVKRKSCLDQVKALHDKDTQPVSHIIMDMDGVVLNANDYDALAHEEYLMKWKKNLKLKTRYKVLGLRNEDAGKIITEEYEMPFDEKVYANGIWQIQRELYHKVRVVRGMDDVVCYFLKQRYPLALISSTRRKAFNILYSRMHGLEKDFCHVVTGDDVVDGKPKPDILIKAARLFIGGPRDLSKYLVFESSYSGALAARAAGMQVVLLTDPQMPDEMKAAANVVLYHMSEFEPSEFHMPPMKK